MYFRRSAAEAERRRQTKASGIQKSSSYRTRQKRLSLLRMLASRTQNPQATQTQPNNTKDSKNASFLSFCNLPGSMLFGPILHSYFTPPPPLSETIRKSRRIIKIQNGVSASTTNNYKPCLFTLFYSDYKSFGWNKSGNP